MTPDTNLKDKFAGLSPTNLRIEPGANTQGCDLFYTTDEQDPLGDTGTPYTDGKIGFKWAEQPSPVVFKCVHCVAPECNFSKPTGIFKSEYACRRPPRASWSTPASPFLRSLLLLPSHSAHDPGHQP